MACLKHAFARKLILSLSSILPLLDQSSSHLSTLFSFERALSLLLLHSHSDLTLLYSTFLFLRCHLLLLSHSLWLTTAPGTSHQDHLETCTNEAVSIIIIKDSHLTRPKTTLLRQASNPTTTTTTMHTLHYLCKPKPI